MDIRKHGLYSIVRVFTNNTILVQISEHIQERNKVRKLSPYRRIYISPGSSNRQEKLRLDPWWEIV